MARVAAVIALLVAIGAAAFFVLRKDDSGEKSKAAVTAFASAWARGDDAGAGALTDAPKAAAAALAANRKGLDGAKVAVTPGPLTIKDDTATGDLRVSWTVPKIGTYAYSSPVTATKGKDAWIVHYTPKTIHPRLTADTRLGTSATAPHRADIEDRNGNALIQDRAVVRVGLAHDKIGPDSAQQLAKALDIDADAYAKAVKNAGPKQFVEAQTLRKSDFDKLDLPKIAGLLTVDGTAPLAPTREFARALLGGVTDGKGQWGLEQVFDTQLAGTPTRRILIRETETGDAVRTLRRFPGKAAKPLKTTLDTQVQTAAEHALDGVDQEAAIVAVKPSSGDILAVANRPEDSTFDRALAGGYAPGSTFKVITTAALLRHGFDPSSTVACPKTITVDGRTFKNFEGEEGGQVPFSDDFAISCNTAFISLSPKLPADALHDTAGDYGLGRSYKLPVATAATQVPPGADKVARAAAMIGQDKITVTPLAMAGVAAAVADGRWRQPRLVSTDAKKSGPKLPASELGTLHSLMRKVVTSGTAATALASTPGEIAGKTGTAEFGTADPPDTHAWFIAYRGDLAVAVLVEKGRSGGSVAAPLAAKLFSALG